MKYTWRKLVLEITELYTLGKNESEISEIINGSVILDKGKVERVEEDSEYSGFIQLNMPRIETVYKNKLIVGDFLALNFSKLLNQDIQDICKGSLLEFKTHVGIANGPFPAIEVTEFEGEKEINIMIGTTDSQII